MIGLPPPLPLGVENHPGTLLFVFVGHGPSLLAV